MEQTQTNQQNSPTGLQIVNFNLNCSIAIDKPKFQLFKVCVRVALRPLFHIRMIQYEDSGILSSNWYACSDQQL
jgi:hypothetical protein